MTSYIKKAELLFVALAFVVMLGIGVATSANAVTEDAIAVPVDQEEKPKIKLSPIYECSVRVDADTWKVFWGYENKSTLGDSQYTVDASEINQSFSGGDATLPTEFVYPNVVDGRPGRTNWEQRTPNAFTTMQEYDSGNQVWSLNGKTATANSVRPYKICPTYFQFAKEWTGDAISTDEVRVTFKADKDFEWRLGKDMPVSVDPGESTLTGVNEEVDGLPANCTYTNNLPTEITAPEEGYDENNIFTLTVTNEVECDEPNEVDTEEVPQVTQTPTGGVDAGAGESIAVAVAGLIGSIALAGGAFALRKFNA